MLQNNFDLLEQQLRILSEARFSKISERDAYGLISTVPNTNIQANFTFNELLAKTKEMMARSKELNNKVFIFPGTWEEFLTEIEKAGVRLDKSYYPFRLEGLDCVECSEWHYVLVGTREAIQKFIKEREELFEIPVITLPTVSDDRFSSRIFSFKGSGCW
jgi:hypothetical protein